MKSKAAIELEKAILDVAALKAEVGDSGLNETEAAMFTKVEKKLKRILALLDAA